MTLNPEQFYGKGYDAMFPEDGSPVRGAPFPRAGRNKRNKDYDTGLVRSALRNPPDLTEVDPRTLSATQPSITAPGVRHYMGNDWETTGRTYADQGNPGNRFPVVYNRTEPSGAVTHMLLSGHHRATAALLQAKELPAVVIEGGYGRPRKSPPPTEQPSEGT